MVMTPERDAYIKDALDAGNLSGAIRAVADAVRGLGDQPKMNARLESFIERLAAKVAFLEDRATFSPPLPLLFHRFPGRDKAAGGPDNPAEETGDTAASLSEAKERAERHFKSRGNPGPVLVRLDSSEADDPVFRAERLP